MSNYFLTKDDLKIEESIYKPDLEILNKYQEFSSELLRVSLIGIAAIAFFYEKHDGHMFSLDIIIWTFISVKCMLITSLFFLSLSSFCALMHRYFSTDSVTYMISSLRYANAETIEILDLKRKNYYKYEAEKERKKQKKLFKLCRYLILV